MDASVIVSGLLNGGLYATIGLGLALVFGVMRLVNLAHGEFIVMGAYFASLIITWMGVDPFISLILVIPVMMLLAYPIQKYLFTGLLRRGVEPPLVAAFGLSLLFGAAITQIFGGDARSLSASYATAGVDIFGLRLRAIDIVGFSLGVLLVVAAYLVMNHTQWGSALRAAASDPQTAGTLGINVERVYALTFAASAGIAAIGGVIIGVGYSFTPTAGTNFMLIGFTVVVLGGMGSIMGTLWGGLALGLIQSVGSSVLGGEYRDLVIYATFIIVLAVKPIIARIQDAKNFRPLPATKQKVA